MSRRVMQVLSRFTPPMEVYSIDESFLDLSGLGKRLNRLRIDNALALKQANPQLIRKHFGVVMECIVRELNGIPCIPMEMIPPKRKQILTSRSFGTQLSTLPELRAAVSVFATRSAEKLRSQNLFTQALCVFIHTSPFDLSKPGYNNAMTLSWDKPTQDTGVLIRYALAGLERIFRPGYQYQRTGVLLPDLMPNGLMQLSIFQDDVAYNPKSERLMTVLDAINQDHGRYAIRYASQGLSARWQMRQQLKSPAYTTRWECLPVAMVR